MNLTKGHNNLTKLNEIASCIYGRFCNENNIWLWIGISYHRGTLFCFYIFLKTNTLDIEHHVGEDYRNST